MLATAAVAERAWYALWPGWASLCPKRCSRQSRCRRFDFGEELFRLNRLRKNSVLEWAGDASPQRALSPALEFPHFQRHIRSRLQLDLGFSSLPRKPGRSSLRGAWHIPPWLA